MPRRQRIPDRNQIRNRSVRQKPEIDTFQYSPGLLHRIDFKNDISSVRFAYDQFSLFHAIASLDYPMGDLGVW
jgi:hypothetical protein